jgi:drug/metabolite transporter (DMT)-like permease
VAEVSHAGVIFGLIAAIGWGTSAVAATNAARRAGTYIAVLGGQGVGVVVLVVLAAFLHPSLGSIDSSAATGLVGAGLLGLLGYLTFYRALEYGGAVGLVSAISATYGGITTLLAVIVLGEHISGFGAAGVVLAVTGVAMASAHSPGTAEGPSIAVAEPIVGVALVPSRMRGLSRAGVPLALASAVTYGAGGFLLGDYSAQVGALGSALVAHGSSVTVLLLALPFLGRRKAWRASASGMMWAAAAGLTDVVGLLAFSRGGQAGQVAVTAAVSSVYPAIPLIAGLVMFGETLGRRQRVGVSLIIGGLVMISVS